MKNPFTVEESNLICIYSNQNRQKALDGLNGSLEHQTDKDMVNLTYETIHKLSQMSDEEFSQLNLVGEKVE